jgi:hypothetical protein
MKEETPLFVLVTSVLILPSYSVDIVLGIHALALKSLLG